MANLKISALPNAVALGGSEQLAGVQSGGNVNVTPNQLRTFFQVNPLALTPPSLTGSAATSSLSIAQTWNTTGTPTALDLNVTDTASNASSLLINLRVGGTSRLSVRKDGFTVSAFGFGANNFYSQAGGQFGSVATVQGIANSFVFSGAISLASNASLVGEAANTLALRNGTAAQALNVYNTFTDASNYERGVIKWNANVLEIGSETAGTGANRTTLIRSTGSLVLGKNLVTLRDNNTSSTISTWGSGQAGSPNSFIGTESNHAFGLRSNSITRLALDTVGSVQIATALTVATLPGTPTVGMIARVTNASAPAVGATVAGGGAAAALVWYNGTNWTVIGV